MAEARHDASAAAAAPTRSRGRARAPCDHRVGDGSGVVESGAAFMPAVIFVWTKPGRTIMTCTPLPARRSPRPWSTVDAGLRRAVDEVGLAHPLAGDRRQQHDRAVALASQPLRQRHARPTRAGVVGLHDLERGVGVVLGLLCVAEHAEGDHDEVDVAEARRTRRRRTPSCAAKSVASNAHRLDPRRARGAQLGGGGIEALRVAAPRARPCAPGRRRAARDRDTRCRSRRRARAPTARSRGRPSRGTPFAARGRGGGPCRCACTPSGSTRGARLAPAVELRVHRGESSGRRRESFVR